MLQPSTWLWKCPKAASLVPYTVIGRPPVLKWDFVANKHDLDIIELVERGVGLIQIDLTKRHVLALSSMV